MSKFFQVKHSLSRSVPFRYICRDHTKDGAEGFLRGNATFVTVIFACDVMKMDKFALERFVLEQTNWVDEYLNEVLNDTVLVSTEDPLANVIIILEQENMVDVRLMRDVTRTGLQKMFVEDFTPILKEQTDGKVELASVDVFEAMSFE